MKRLIALVLAALTLAALPAVARADWPAPSVFPHPRDPWASWAARAPHHQAFADPRFAPGFSVAPLAPAAWVPGYWFWTGWQWAWVPGYWSR
jgi:hypothetical protein